MLRNRLFLLVVFFLITIVHCSLFPVLLANAETFSVSVSVGQTTLTFSGLTIPEAQVTFIESGAVVGTTQADEDGNFTKSLIYFEEGVRTVGFYVTDGSGRTSSTISYTVSLILGIDTSLSNIILPPTIALDSSEITRGDILTLFGESVPLSSINLFFSNSSSVGLTAEITGLWEYEYDTGGLTAGDYTVYAKASTALGYQSENSETKSFTIMAPAPTATPTLTPAPTAISATNTPGPGPTNTPGPGAAAAPVIATPTPKPKPSLPSLISELFDFNQSGKIELSETYSVVKKWVGSWRGYLAQIFTGKTAEKEQYASCDLNHDSICNLVDFSILMYYVNR